MGPPDARAPHGRFCLYAAAMTDDQLLRYSRHILLDELGIEGQQRLLAAHALVDRKSTRLNSSHG